MSDDRVTVSYIHHIANPTELAIVGKPRFEELLKRKIAQYCDTHDLQPQDLTVRWDGPLIHVWGCARPRK